LPSPRPRRTRAAGHLKLSLEPLARLSVHRQSRHRRRRRRVPLPAPNYLPAPASTTRLLLPLPLPLPELTPPPPDRPAAPPSACSVQQGAHQGRPADGARRPYLEPRNQLKSTWVGIPSLPSPSTGQIRCSPTGISAVGDALSAQGRHCYDLLLSREIFKNQGPLRNFGK
jgi:hypothetical protein